MRRAGFTIVELLVAMGIIATLAGILMPALATARQSARLLNCQNNMRQIGVALIEYASASQGYFPPNDSTPSPGMYWYDPDRIGQFLSGYALTGGNPGGNILQCPNDTNGLRSYAMNAWASAALTSADLLATPAHGLLWGKMPPQSSRMILVIEALSTTGGPSGYYAPATVGFFGTTGASRFGAFGGFSPSTAAGRWGNVSCELDFSRHAIGSDAQINVCFADGHVAAESASQLVSSPGVLSGEAYWSALDLP